MKKPNIDLSKDGMKRFFLYHSEKLVLGLGIVLTGLFFWLGFQAKPFSETAPKKLSQKADEANAYIQRNTNWEKIAEFRQADDTVHVRIEESDKRVNLDEMIAQYDLGYTMGTPISTLGLRTDPEILAAEELVARTFYAPMLLNQSSVGKPLNTLEKASSSTANQVANGRGGGNDEDEDEDEDDEDDRRSRKNEVVDIGMGDSVPEYQKLEKGGIRGEVLETTPVKSRAYMMNGVVVTGKFNYKEQLANYDAALRNGLGYYPPRDKPIFKRVQIQRKKQGEDEWKDITKRVFETLPETFLGTTAGITRDTKFEVSGTDRPSAPEVVAPKYYDPALTGPIPSFTDFDYTSLAIHPNFPMEKARRYSTPDIEEDEDNETKPADSQQVGNRDPFGNAQAQSQVENKKGANTVATARAGNDYSEYVRLLASSRKDNGINYKMVRFFDLNLEEGATYTYRIRVWLVDPNSSQAAAVTSVAKKGDRSRDNLSMGGGGGASGMSRDDQGGAAKGGAGDMELEESYKFVAVTDNMNDKMVRTRLKNTKAPEDENDSYQIGARAAQNENGELVWTTLSEPVTIPKAEAGYVYTGTVNPPQASRIGEIAIPNGEPTAILATRSFEVSSPEISGNSLGVPVSGRREAYRSDVLNYKSTTHVFNPIDTSVRILPDAELKTNKMVVDMMGGEKDDDVSPRVRGSAVFKMQFSRPSEVLIYDFETQQFKLHNAAEERSEFLHSLFLEDDNARIGGRKPKKSDDDEAGGLG